MELLPADLRTKLPPLYGQEGVKDAVAHVKLFDPCGRSTWFILEFDGADVCFGWAIVGNSLMGELGYFSLGELERVRGRLGIGIERDLYFSPKPLRQAIADQKAFQ